MLTYDSIQFSPLSLMCRLKSREANDRQHRKPQKIHPGINYRIKYTQRDNNKIISGEHVAVEINK
jgi:hypothetical protein